MARILIADDDPDIRELIAFKLEQAGHEVIQASDGREALEAVRQHIPSLVVLDVVMPGTSGMEVCRQLRADPLTAQVPIILLTSSSEDSTVEDGFRSGADDYVVKPFRPRELLQRVNRLIERVPAAP